MQMAPFNLCLFWSVIVRAVYNRRGTFGDHSAVAWAPVSYGPFWVWRPVALWSLWGLCVTVLGLASAFSHPGSLTNTHTPCPCVCFFSLLLKQKEFKYFLSTHLDQHVTGSLGPWWDSGQVGWERGEKRTENFNQVPSCPWDEDREGVGTGVPSAGRPDAQSFISACSCQILSSSLWLLVVVHILHVRKGTVHQ